MSDNTHSLGSKLSNIALKGLILKASGAIVGLLLHLVLARTMNTTEFGAFILAFTLASISTIFASFGLPFSASKYIPMYLSTNNLAFARGFFRIGHIVTIGGSLIFSTCFLLTIHWFYSSFSSSLAGSLIIASISIPFLTFSQSLAAYLQSLKQIPAAELIANIIRPVTTILLTLLYFLLINKQKITADTVMMIMLFASCLTVVVGLKIYRSYTIQFTPELKPKYDYKEWFKSGFATLFILGGIILNEKLDILMVGSLLGAESTAIYGVSAKLAMVVGFAISAVNSILGPMLSSIYAQKDFSKLRRISIFGAWLSFLTSLIIGFCLVFLSPYILGLFGEIFIQGQNAFIILIASQIVIAIFGGTGGLAIIFGGYQITFLSVCIGLLVNFTLNFSLVPSLGIIGASIATLVAMLITHLIVTIWLYRKININATIFGGMPSLKDNI